MRMTLFGAEDHRYAAPGDRDYNEARSLWNGMVDRRPALIARCTNVTGNAMCDGGIVINLSLMRRCDVDVGRRMVHVDGGGPDSWDLDHK